jgi:hypothetical protein
LPIPTIEVHGASGYLAKVIRRQRFRSFQNDLHGAFHRPAMHVTGFVLHKRKVANDRGYAIDLIANMKQTGAGTFAAGHQKIRTASRSPNASWMV